MEKMQIWILLLVAVIVGSCFGSIAFPREVVVEKPVVKTVTQEKVVEVPKIEYVDKIVEKKVEVPVEVPVEIEVDNGKLDMVLQYFYDNDLDPDLIGNLDKNEREEIVDRIEFFNEIKGKSIEGVNEEFTDLIHKEEFNVGEPDYAKFYKDEVERIKVDRDIEDVEIEFVDFEDKDAETLVEVKFEQDDVKYKAIVEVEFKDGKIDDYNIYSIELR